MSAWGEEEKVAVALVKGSLSAAKDANLQKEDFHLHHKHIGMEKSHSSSPAQKSREM